MKHISEEPRIKWAYRLDKFCAITGALIPVGIVVGKVGFEAIVGLVGLCWIIRSILARENPLAPLIKHPLVLPWIVWFACIVVSLLVNGAGSKGWAHDFVFIRFILYALALLDISKRLPIAKYFLYGLAAGMILATINTISAYTFGFDLLGKPLIRYTAKLKEAGRISAVAAYASPFFLALGLFDDKLSKKEKRIFVWIGLIAFILLIQTRGRTTIIASLAGIFFCIAYFFRQRFSPILTLTIILSLALGTVLFLQDKRTLDLYSLYDRIYYWKVSWAVWIDHPVLGVGVSSFQDAYKEMAASGAVSEYIAPDGRIFKYPEITHAHNLILMLLAATGLPGLAAFSWLFINAVKLIKRKETDYRAGLISWPIVFLVIGITGFNIYNSEYQALLAFFLVLAGCNNITTWKDPHA